MDRLQKAAMVIVTQNQQKVLFEVLTDNGQTLKHSNAHSDAEPTDAKLLGTEGRWTYCRREQWAQ